MTMRRVDIKTEAGALTEYWSQKTVGNANDNLFKVAKGIGSTTWHKHDDQDEVFCVYQGRLTMRLRTGDVELREGDMFIVPRGVEHCTRADEEVFLLLIGRDITSHEKGGKPAWSYDGGRPTDSDSE